MTALVTQAFDSLRREDDCGEYWSARDLCSALGYDKWENFDAAVVRARHSINASGQEAPDHIRGAGKMVLLGSGAERRVIDYHLTRFGAYMVAMNGDPRKPEIAAAQTYFAVRTRQAEVGPQLVALPSRRQLALMVIEAEEALELAEAKVAELEPKAEVADRLLDADGDLCVADAAKALTRAGIKLGAGRLFTVLAERRWIYRAGADQRWHVYQAAIEAGYMSVLPQSHYHPRSGALVLDPPQPRVTPKGLQRLLNDARVLAPV